jgi:hypothetical protein
MHIKIHRHTQTYHQVVVEICKEVWRSAAGPQTVRQRFEVPYQEGVVDSNVVVNSQVVVDIYHSVFLLWPSRKKNNSDQTGKSEGWRGEGKRRRGQNLTRHIVVDICR